MRGVQPAGLQTLRENTVIHLGSLRAVFLHVPQVSLYPYRYEKGRTKLLRGIVGIAYPFSQSKQLNQSSPLGFF
jgi:hypothetical protein